MKEFISDFFKLQNDRMKSPFFSAVVFSILFYNWDVIYFFISSNTETLSKIDYIKNIMKERSLIYPFLLTGTLLILPIVINNAVQWLTDHLTSIRTNRLNRYKIKRGEDELKIAHLEASKSFEPKKVEMHVQNNIDKIIDENNLLTISLDEYKEQITDLKDSIDSERKASEDSRAHTSFLSSELETSKYELSNLNDKWKIELSELKKVNEIQAVELSELKKVNSIQSEELSELKKVNTIQSEELFELKKVNTIQSEELFEVNSELKKVNKKQSIEIFELNDFNKKQSEEVFELYDFNKKQSEEFFELNDFNKKQSEEFFELNDFNKKQSEELFELNDFNKKQAAEVGTARGYLKKFDIKEGLKFFPEMAHLDPDTLSAMERSNKITEFFQSKFNFELFEILKDTPMNAERIWGSLTTNIHSKGEVIKALSELQGSGLVKKSPTGVYILTKKGENVASQLKLIP
ncbi:hypothetical protein [Shewanella scandinavica]|uniref:hypothetical protein n=1 Tax=Shewanella scandinavica TaxID=3063538 RepID=UPI00318C4132